MVGRKYLAILCLLATVMFSACGSNAMQGEFQPTEDENFTPQGTEGKEESSQQEDATVGNGSSNSTVYNDGSVTIELRDNTVYISGTGEISNLSNVLNAYAEQADTIIVEEGIEKLCEAVFLETVGYETLILPESVNYIESVAFMSSGFVTIKMPSNLTFMGAQVFANCNQLQEINLPKISGEIGLFTDIFVECTGLKSVTIPADLVLSQSADMFVDCANLSTVIYQDGATTVKFQYTGTDLDIQIPSSVTEIEVTGVRRIYGEVGSYAQKYAAERGISFFVGDIGDASATPDNSMEIVERPTCPDVEMDWDRETDFADFSMSGDIMVFYGNTDITNMNNDVEIIKKYKPVNLFILDGITAIGERVFQKNENLEYVHMEDSVKRIEQRAFYSCNSLEEVVLSEGLLFIGEEAFRETALKKVEIPGMVEEIGESAFYQTGLREVYIADGVQSIGELAFANCPRLIRIRIPESVTNISDTAFLRSGTDYQGVQYGSESSFLVIVGKKGSVAEQFAINNGYQFEVE